MAIHPTAIISQQAEISNEAEIGPFVVVLGRTKIGARTRVASHAVIGNEFGETEIGEDNVFSSGAAIGGAPQDLKYKGEPTRLTIGHRNMFREFCTVNTGTPGGGGVTQIGDQNLIMSYVHVAHDCHIGNNVIIANTTNFAGHVTVQDNVRIGGVCSFNQFITIGRYAYIAGDSAVNKDVLPFTIAQGKYAVSRATNKIGLERAGFSKDEVENIHRAVRLLLMGERTQEEALIEIEEKCSQSEHILFLLDFIRRSERGIAK